MTFFPPLEKLRIRTVEVLSHKYLYYEVERRLIPDEEYDLLKEDYCQLLEDLGEKNTLPKAFDYNHPLALDAIKQAKKQLGVYDELT